MISQALMRQPYDEATYNCAHFTVDAWYELTGNSLHEQLEPLLCAESEREMPGHVLERFKRTDEPVTPSIVVMERGDGKLHMGVWWDNGIYHITQLGVHHATLARIGMEYRNLRFYAWTG